jgi:hypothetical protein
VRRPAPTLALAAILLAPAPLRAGGAPADPSDPLLEQGRALAAKKDAAGAYAAFAAALRASLTQDGKDAARDGLLALPIPPAPGLTDRERAVVGARIDEERARFLRDVANRLLDRKKLRGALKILEVVRGSLQEEATAKVIGDPKGAERREREVADLRIRIFGDIPEAQKAEADALVARLARSDPERLLREAARLRKENKPLAARRVLQGLLFDPAAPAGPKDAARARIDEIEKEHLAALDPEERKAVDEALACPVFGRLQTISSREFIYIGDYELLARIPEKSRFLLDVAYVALTDLAGYVPNADGSRITIFFKELWDFPGGIGGGTIIDIGRADPKGRQAVLVHSGLYFHELSHCVLQPEPRFPGWIEGIANFGAAFCALFLRQEGEEWPSAKENLEAFRRDYLDREETYWRTAPYGPSAGWFLHWIDAYGKRASGRDWIRYGRVLRGFAAQDPRPESVAGTARLFGSLLAREFGAKVWEDLKAQRFPCEEGPVVDPGWPDGEAHMAGRRARMALEPGGATGEEAERYRREAGFLTGWKVCGPFYPDDRGDGLASIFPPEREIRLDREYASPRQVARWFAPAAGSPVEESPTGVVTAKWAYPADSVTYGAVDVQVEEAVDAWAWVGATHRWALWVDDVLVEKQDWECGDFLVDRDRVPLRLEKGRHRVLFKEALGWRGPGFAVRLTDRAGKGLPGFRCFPAEDRPWTAPDPIEGKPHFKDEFRRADLGGAWTGGPGGWLVRNHVVRGTENRGGVPWRKYSVRPGFPQDSPSNSLTLDPKVMQKAGKDLRVEVRCEGNPKIALTLDAEDAPGGLTGWTAILVPMGATADVRLERYDRLLYLATGVALGREKEHVLAVERRGGRVSVLVDGLPALDRVSAPPLARDGLRISTWGADPALTRVEIRRLD